VHYSFRKEQETVGRGLTRHVSILTASRNPCPLPAGIERWLAASTLEGVLGALEP
jgi:hypothetical protein